MRNCFAMKCLTVCFAWLLVVNGSYGWANPHQKGKFQMGTGVIDITPPIGYRMSGYFHERLSTRVKDPLLAKAYGDHFVSLFGIGTCGDINHVNTSTKERNKTDVIGRLLAESVAQAMPGLQPVAGPSLAVVIKWSTCPSNSLPPNRLLKQRRRWPA
jgi:hypothetical protein